MTVRRSISRILADRAAAAPDEPIVTDAHGVLTAAELDAAATRLAALLRARGVAPHDLVAVSLPNDRDIVIACFAIWRAGATPQAVPRHLSPANRAALEASARPAAAIGAAPVTAAIPWLEGVHAPHTPDGPLPDLAAGSWKAMATSGSTGRPKVVVAAGPALLDPARPVAPFLPMRAVQLVAGPLTHAATFTYAFRGLMTGHRLVILPRFDERAWLDAVERHGATWGLVVPTMLHRLMRLPAAERDPRRLRSLEGILHMGAPCSTALKHDVLAWLGPERVTEVYAGSESNGLTMIRGDEWLSRPGSVGRPIGGTEIRILRPDGTPAAAGETGEVWMRRGSAPSYAYLSGVSRRDEEGWDTLGDLGRLDADGYLFLVDRADDVINRGGEKIHPARVEHVLEEHPAVRSAVAFGLPDDEWGQVVGAVCDIADADAPGLRDWAATRLGPHAPAVLHIVRDPVRDDAGKTNRRAWATRVSQRRPA